MYALGLLLYISLLFFFPPMPRRVALESLEWELSVT